MADEVVVRDLRKCYDGIEAVRGVSFEVRSGEIFGLLGPNGAGKTTTIECILGLRHPDSGAISVGGIDALAEPQRVKRIISAALQSTGLQDKITPGEALELFGSFYRDAIKPAELLHRFSLLEKADSPVDTLSGGQRQRLALALAFVNDPKLVFLDEPTAGLDPQSRRELHEVIAKMRTDGRSVILTTHYIEEAQQLCDRIAIIDRGRVIAIGKPEELIAAAKSPAVISVRTRKILDMGTVQVLPGVVGSELNDAGWKMRTSDVTQTVIGLVKQLEADANDLIDLQIHRPTLEDVFIELTGQRLGDD